MKKCWFADSRPVQPVSNAETECKRGNRWQQPSFGLAAKVCQRKSVEESRAVGAMPSPDIARAQRLFELQPSIDRGLVCWPTSRRPTTRPIIGCEIVPLRSQLLQLCPCSFGASVSDRWESVLRLFTILVYILMSRFFNPYRPASANVLTFLGSRVQIFFHFFIPFTFYSWLFSETFFCIFKSRLRSYLWVFFH